MALHNKNYSQEKGSLLEIIKRDRSSPSLQKLKEYLDLEIEDTVRKLLKSPPETVETFRMKAAAFTELKDKLFG